MSSTIVCPNCQKTIELTQALTSQLQKEIAQKTEERLRKEFQERNSVELEDMKRQLAEKEEKVSQMREAELQLREEKRRLEEKEKELTLEVQRQIDEEKKKIEQQVLEQAAREHRLKDLEKEKVINDLKTALEEAQRKAQQGSQQLQGEILELDLEHLLKTTFPQDIIEPIAKGVNGADIRQIVKSPLGNNCGTILWESKRTKAWSDGWIAKLKQDALTDKAHLLAIISEALPEEAKSGMGSKNGVSIANPKLAIALATLLRNQLLAVARQIKIAQNQQTDSERLYSYVTSHDFQHQVESMIGTYLDMQQQIQKERASMERLWSLREQQVQKLIRGVSGIYGSMQEKVGSSMPQVRGLELEVGE